MTKNITAVLFTLLLSAAVFAQSPITSGGAPGPAWQPQHGNNSSSSANDVILQETNAIARSFAHYQDSSALPGKAKTRATLHYILPSNGGMDNMGQVSNGIYQKKEIPAVLVAAQNNENAYFLALPAQELQRIPSDSFDISYSLTLINNAPLTIKSSRFVSKEKGCPDGMTLYKAQRANEADICLLQQSVKTSYRKEQFKKLFTEKRVTTGMAAQALKRK